MIGDCLYTKDVLLDKEGYPRVKHQGKMFRLNRLFYTYLKGEIPEGYVVAHRCNNKGCVNIDHLYLATPHQNSTDAAKDGLYRSGVTNGRSKLTTDDVINIRNMYAAGLSQDYIAELFNTSQSSVSSIIRKRSYKDI